MVGVIIFGVVAEPIKNKPDLPSNNARGIAKASPSNRARSTNHTITKKQQSVNQQKNLLRLTRRRSLIHKLLTFAWAHTRRILPFYGRFRKQVQILSRARPHNLEQLLRTIIPICVIEVRHHSFQ